MFVINVPTVQEKFQVWGNVLNFYKSTKDTEEIPSMGQGIKNITWCL